MKNEGECSMQTVVSDTSTPNEKAIERVLAAETQMSPKPPANPIEPPENNNNSFETSFSSQPQPTKYAKITKISQLHSPKNPNNNNNNNKTDSLSSMESEIVASGQECFNESSGHLSKSSTSCSSGIASNVIHENIIPNLEDPNRISAFSPVRKFSYQASNVGAFQVQVDKIPIGGAQIGDLSNNSSTLYVP